METIKKFTNTNKVFVIPNGIDLNLIQKIVKLNGDENNRKSIISIRGLTELYRIHEILLSRSATKKVLIYQ